MADLHIEDFFKDAAKILIQLYIEFPQKTIVFVEDVSGADTMDEYGLHSPRHLSCFGCMIWLKEEGFLRFQETIRQEGIDQAILTGKSFSLLSKSCRDPDQLDLLSSFEASATKTPKDIQTNIHLIRKTLQHGTSIQLADVMQALLFSD